MGGTLLQRNVERKTYQKRVCGNNLGQPRKETMEEGVINLRKWRSVCCNFISVVLLLQVPG